LQSFDLYFDYMLLPIIYSASSVILGGA